nr:MAG: putative capsid protein 1 [Polycipiviridae sp.]
MEVIQNKETGNNLSRAKDIDTGAIPLPMSNVILGLPVKPDPSNVTEKSGVISPTWTLQDLLSQKQLLTDININPNITGIVWEFTNSWRDVVSKVLRPNLASAFCLKSWTINFDFQFRSNFQQVGQFVIFYSNLPKLAYSYHFNLESIAASTHPYVNYIYQTQLPHRKIPMGENVDVPVSLKWVSPLKSSFGAPRFSVSGSEFGSDPLYDMGTLHLAVPWPMEVSTGVTQDMTVRIWVSLSDVTYSGYIPDDTHL